MAAIRAGEPPAVVTQTLRVVEFAGSLADQLAQPAAAVGEVVLYWLGQAGFVLDWDGRRILIDPYLSDSLARKYRGTRYAHVRTMASPIAPELFTRVDLVLCTHRHTDHMDPDTLQPLGRIFPELRFVVPAASATEASKRCGVHVDRLLLVNAGDDIEPLPGLRIRPIASAHETLDVDEKGRHEWMGYVIDVAGTRLYHSGDCVPYPGLADSLTKLAPRLALLPVNGRDAERSSNGIPGNFTLDEAVALCRNAGMSAMVAHHYGMFEFNTVPASVVDSRAALEAQHGLSLMRARLGVALHVTVIDANDLSGNDRCAQSHLCGKEVAP